MRAALPKIENIGGSESCASVILWTNTFTTKACGEIFRIQSGPITCNSEKVIYFKFIMTLPILGRLNQGSVSCLTAIKVNADLLERPMRMSHKIAFIDTIFKIATKVLMIEKPRHLKSVKRTNNSKKRTFSAT